MPKYKDYVRKMVEDNKELFDSFKEIHDLYVNDNEKWQNKYNTEGKKILEIVREYENKLCRNTERGVYNKFSTRLAEKFQNEVRKLYPAIDSVGIIIETPPEEPVFTLKKIKLS